MSGTLGNLIFRNGMIEFDKTKTLSQLETKKWMDKTPSEDDSYVVRNSYKLFHKPLDEFDVEDLRFIIGQNIGLKFTVPLALETLKTNPFAEGDYYEGDLLKNVLEVDKGYWLENKELYKEFHAIFILNEPSLNSFDLPDEIKNKLRSAFEKFSKMS